MFTMLEILIRSSLVLIKMIYFMLFCTVIMPFFDLDTHELSLGNFIPWTDYSINYAIFLSLNIIALLLFKHLIRLLERAITKIES